jgi:DNA-binding NtrC family response regulator
VAANILVVDDDQFCSALLEVHLEEMGYSSLIASGAREALGLLAENKIDLVLSDLVMPEMDGMALLKQVKGKYPAIPFIIMTGYGGVDNAVAALKQGAHDFVQKPISIDELHAAIGNALDYHRLSEENQKLREQLRGTYCFRKIVSTAPAMIRALKLAEKVVPAVSTTVAIFGESGSGKEVLARAIHYSGEALENRFVAVNCAGIPAALLESELFGHVKGAFTGADRDRAGKFDLARKGTILLDEVGDMPLELQAKLLRVIQEREYEPVGSNRKIAVDFRIIVATHRDLADLVRRGEFRNDLYHRITTFPITIPPLRERKEDIPLLTTYFLNQLREELGKPIPGVSRKGMELLINHSWPGNVRELRNALERAAILIENELINPIHLTLIDSNAEKTSGNATSGNSFASGAEDLLQLHIAIKQEDFSLDAVIDKVLEMTLQRCNNNKSLAAQLLKADRRVFYRRKS